LLESLLEIEEYSQMWVQPDTASFRIKIKNIGFVIVYFFANI